MLRSLIALVTALAAGATCLPATTAQAQERDLKFVLDFISLGRHAPWYVALGKGYFKDEGLNVTIMPSKGTADAIRTVATGGAELGLLPALSNRHGLITGATGTGKTVTLQVMGADLRRHPPGHLRHRGQQRQRPVGQLDGLVGDGRDPRVEQRVGAFQGCGKVQVGEQDLALAQPVILLGDGLLDLEDQLGLLPHVLDRRERRALARVLLVADAAAEAGAVLDQHAVLALDQGAGAGRRAGPWRSTSRRASPTSSASASPAAATRVAVRLSSSASTCLGSNLGVGGAGFFGGAGGLASAFFGSGFLLSSLVKASAI